jgi:hypothetical protein
MKMTVSDVLAILISASLIVGAVLVILGITSLCTGCTLLNEVG